MGIVLVVEFLSERSHLSSLELGDLDRSPALCGTRHGGEHQLEDGLLAKGVGNDLEAPAFFDEQSFQQVRGPRRPTVPDRHPQVRTESLGSGNHDKRDM